MLLLKGDKVQLFIQSRKKGSTSSIAPKHSGSYTVLEVLNYGTNYIIKNDAKRSRAKIVNRRQLRLCRTRIDLDKKYQPNIIDITKDINDEITITKTSKFKSTKPIITKQATKIDNPQSQQNSEIIIKKKRGRPKKQIAEKNDDAQVSTEHSIISPQNQNTCKYILRSKKKTINN